MSSAKIAYVFLDANAALHFKRADLIDWPALTGTDAVELIAAPVFLRELEKQKVHNPSPKLAKRADSYIKWLRLFIRQPDKPVRQSVTLRFLQNEPSLDFETCGLSRTIADDHLVASVLDTQSELDGPIFVATADIGLEVKLHSRSIDVLELRDDLKLPPEPDERDKELRKLRTEVAQLQSRMPSLSVSFANGKTFIVANLLDASRFDAPSLEQIKAERILMPNPGHPENSGESPNKSVRTFNFDVTRIGVSPDAIARYNTALEDYYANYQKYLEALPDWQVRLGLHFPVAIRIANTGSSPASDIDLELTFPDFVLPIEFDDFPNEPVRPKPPRKPDSSTLGAMTAISEAIQDRPYLNNLPAMGNNDGVPIINADGRTTRIHFDRIKHTIEEETDKFLLGFTSVKAVSSFAIEYHLSAAEIPDRETGQLHVRI